MPLALGTKLGPYEIISPLGAGGMGEVYRAKDTRLDRTVAIKILPASISADPLAKQRFEREAKTISGLNHPNICTLHDVGNQDGLEYLVMECLEGETLAQRLEKGALPLEQVLKIGAQLADALDKAHRSGIVHRDLKPGNVMLTPSGVKLLDFGLAKPAAPLLSGLTMTASVPASPVTEQGTVVGTFQYMSPEQVEGKDVDSRSDIFSLGAVLYEMVTSKRAFAGKSQLSVASAILEKEPEPLTASNPNLPAALDRAIRTCLAKDPEDRWQSARDLASELRWMQQAGSQTGAPAILGAPRRNNARWLWAAAILAALAAGLAAGKLLHRDVSAPELRVSLNLPPGFTLEGDAALALSPDGRTLAFVATGPDGPTKLWSRTLNGQQPQPLNGTEDASYPFWSPDNRFIGFFASHKLKKVEVSSGSVQTLCDASSGRGGTWAADGTIVFNPNYRSGLYRTSESGAVPVQLTNPDLGAGSDRLPHFLPDNKHLLFVRERGLTKGGVFVIDLDSKKIEQISDHPADTNYVAPGYLVFVRAGNLMAQPFDAKSRHTTGEASVIAESVNFIINRFTGRYSFSQVGTAVYEGASGTPAILTIFDEKGERIGALRDSKYFTPLQSLSPDGKRVLLTVLDPENRTLFAWVGDLAKGTGSRLTFGDSNYFGGVWTGDGKRIAYAADLGTATQPSDGSAPPQSFYGDAQQVYPTSWSPDGKFLAVGVSANPNVDIFLLPLTGEKKLIPFISGPGWKLDGSFSPDGKMFAYVSDETGRPEVFVVPYPGPGGKLQVSSEGGQVPNWLHGGKELAYVNSERKLIVVEVSAGGQQLQLGQTRTLFGGHPLPVLPGGAFGSHASQSVYITQDAKRIVLVIPNDLDSIKPLNFISNWTSALNK